MRSAWDRYVVRGPVWIWGAIGSVLGIAATLYALSGLGGAPGVALVVALGVLGVGIAVVAGPVWLREGWSEGEEAGQDETPASIAVADTPVAPLPPPIDGLVMVPIPAGRFLMGSPRDETGRDSDEGPQRYVSVSAFELMDATVTRALFRAVMDDAPSEWTGSDDDDLPANWVSWFDAVRFCNRLSERAGATPCYDIDGESVGWNRAADGFRLPTEAEWEYACRAGSTTPWWVAREALPRHAWFGVNADGEVKAVRTREPYGHGLYDMAGNVWEWCWDWYGSYSEEVATDPDGPRDGEERVLRGGSAFSDVWLLRSARRVSYRPDDRFGDIGFRCSRSPRQP